MFLPPWINNIHWTVSSVIAAPPSKRISVQRTPNLCTIPIGINFISDDILLEHGVTKDVKMNYKNYERNIVKHYGIALIGWPVSGYVQNQSQIGGREQVETLYSALESNTCKWVKLTDVQLTTWIAQNQAWQAAGEKVYHPHCVHGSGTKSKHTVDTSDEESGDD